MDTLFKIRRKNDGAFYAGPIWRPVWNDTGKAYKTLALAKETAATFDDRDNLQIVEYHVVLAAVHSYW